VSWVRRLGASAHISVLDVGVAANATAIVKELLKGGAAQSQNDCYLCI